MNDARCLVEIDRPEINEPQLRKGALRSVDECVLVGRNEHAVDVRTVLHEALCKRQKLVR